MSTTPSISVVVCTRNRLEHLKRCVHSLVNQSLSPKEIIIVDDHSTEDFDVQWCMQQWLAVPKRTKAGMRIDVTLLKNKQHTGIASSRNLGIKVASGDIVAFIDDDGFAHRNWLKNLAFCYAQRKSIVGVGGPIIEIGRKVSSPTKRITKLAYIRNGRVFTNCRVTKLSDAQHLPRKYVQFYMGGNMSFRRSVLLKVNGIDHNLTGTGYREETELCMKVRKHGKLLFEPKAAAYHDSALNGGSSEVIHFKLEEFLYYVYRNTTYLFLKHFRIRTAARFMWKETRRQAKLIWNKKTGVNREYLHLKNRVRTLHMMLLGIVTGTYAYVKQRKMTITMVCSEPISVRCFQLTALSGTMKIIELETKTSVVKKLFGL